MKLKDWEESISQTTDNTEENPLGAKEVKRKTEKFRGQVVIVTEETEEMTSEGWVTEESSDITPMIFDDGTSYPTVEDVYCTVCYFIKDELYRMDRDSAIQCTYEHFVCREHRVKIGRVWVCAEHYDRAWKEFKADLKAAFWGAVFGGLFGLFGDQNKERPPDTGLGGKSSPRQPKRNTSQQKRADDKGGERWSNSDTRNQNRQSGRGGKNPQTKGYSGN